MLLVGEQDANFRAEGREEDGAFVGEAVDAVENTVDEMIRFYCEGFHSQIVGFR